MLFKKSRKYLIRSSFSFLSCSYSLNLFEIRSSASFSFASYLSPLICHFLIFFVFSQICVICFSAVLIQFNKMLTHAGDFKISVNTFSGILLALLVLKLPSLNFLAPCSRLELLLRSRFFGCRSKFFVICVRIIIIQLIYCLR